MATMLRSSVFPSQKNGIAECDRLLKSKRIIDVSVRKDIGDLIVNSEESTFLEILNMSCGYEGWSSGDGADFLAVARVAAGQHEGDRASKSVGIPGLSSKQVTELQQVIKRGHDDLATSSNREST